MASRSQFCPSGLEQDSGSEVLVVQFLVRVADGDAADVLVNVHGKDFKAGWGRDSSCSWWCARARGVVPGFSLQSRLPLPKKDPAILVPVRIR